MTAPAITTSSPQVVASIPSPGSEVLELGPLSFRFYGLMIALGVLAGVWIAQRRWKRWGGDPDDIVSVAIWAVPAGLIGARLYHVITDWGDKYDDGRWIEAFKIWNGGLGIPGAILLGAVVGILVARRLVGDWRYMADAAAPAIPVSQAIGRLGNWFNQELYGRPSDLPWALRIDPLKRPAEYADVATFHPTFLYEGLWNLALAGLIVWGGTKVVLKPGRWFAVYVLGYGVGRLWVESLRIDEATLIAGVRVNIWMSLVIIGGGLLWLFWKGGPLDRDATERLRAGESMADIVGDAVRSTSAPAPAPAAADTADASGTSDVTDATDATDATDSDADSEADGVGEPGPEPESPVVERAVAEGDAGEP